MIFTGGIIKLSRQDFIKSYLENCSNFNEKTDYRYSVILKESDKYIGYCGFQYCDILKDIEILYGNDSKYWGNGYAYEAACATIEYGFNNLGLENIVVAVNPKNPGSEKILLKIGLLFDGNIDWPNQGLVNKYTLSMEQFFNSITNI